jgi:DNA-binding response OmpR family regulator
MNTRIRTKILVIGSNKKLLRSLSRFLEEQKFAVKLISGGTLGLKEALTNKYQLIIIDPAEGKFERLLNDMKFFREKGCNTPIILIQNHPTIEEQIKAYNTGANILHRKPINLPLLLAKVNKLLSDNYVRPEIQLKDILLRPSQRRLFRANKEIYLTRTEFDFFLLLMKAHGSVLSRNYIMSNILNYNRDINQSAVDTMISRIRKKFGEERSPVIETVQGKGYRLGSFYTESRELSYK